MKASKEKKISTCKLKLSHESGANYKIRFISLQLTSWQAAVEDTMEDMTRKLVTSIEANSRFCYYALQAKVFKT